MLRNIKGDLEKKYYTEKAKTLTHYDDTLFDLIKAILGKVNPIAAEGIRSVVRTRSTLVIRAKSRPAMSELYTMRPAIVRAAQREGITELRFSL